MFKGADHFLRLHVFPLCSTRHSVKEQRLGVNFQVHLKRLLLVLHYFSLHRLSQWSLEWNMWHSQGWQTFQQASSIQKITLNTNCQLFPISERVEEKGQFVWWCKANTGNVCWANNQIPPHLEQGNSWGWWAAFALFEGTSIWRRKLWKRGWFKPIP